MPVGQVHKERRRTGPSLPHWQRSPLSRTRTRIRPNLLPPIRLIRGRSIRPSSIHPEQVVPNLENGPTLLSTTPTPGLSGQSFALQFLLIRVVALLAVLPNPLN